MSIPEFREVELTKPVTVEVDAEDIVDAIGNLTDAVAALTTQVEKSADAIVKIISEGTP